MLRAYDIDQEVLEVIVRSPGSMLDDIALQCPDLTGIKSSWLSIV
jgi:hypothetical protein